MSQNQIKVTVDPKAKTMTIVAPLEPPTPSKSGKTLVVASSRGNFRSEAVVNGKPVTVGFNAYIHV